MKLKKRSLATLRAGIASLGVLGLTVGLGACADSAISTAPTPAPTPAESAESTFTEPVKIGLLLPLSGVLATAANDMLDAFNLYLDENDGQIGGRDVELIVEDTEARADVGLTKVNKLLLEDEVDIATGIIISGLALQVASIFEEAEVPLVVANAVADAITGEARNPFVFRTAQSSYQLGYPAGQWIYDTYGDVPLYLIAPEYSAGTEILAAARAGFESRGGTVVGESLPPWLQTQDYQPYLSEIRASGAEVTYGFFAAGEAVNFVTQYDEFGLKDSIPLIGPGSLNAPDVLPAQGAAAEGTLAVLPYTWTMANSRNDEFVASYEAFTGRKPSYYALFSYDAAQLIDLAIRANGGDVGNGLALAQAMEGAEIDSPRGPLTIDAATHGTVQRFYVTRIEEFEGQLAPVIIGELGVNGEQPTE